MFIHSRTEFSRKPYPIPDQKGAKTIPLWGGTYLYDLYKGAPLQVKGFTRLWSHLLQRTQILHQTWICIIFCHYYVFQNRYQAVVFDLVENRKFEMFIISVITINMLVMMAQHYGQPPVVDVVLDILL